MARLVLERDGDFVANNDFEAFGDDPIGKNADPVGAEPTRYADLR